MQVSISEVLHGHILLNVSKRHGIFQFTAGMSLDGFIGDVDAFSFVQLVKSFIYIGPMKGTAREFIVL